jgi:hypothetical protein
MRRAFILLLIVAAAILVFGALNHSVIFDAKYAVGTATAASFFWVCVVLAGLVVVAGVAAAAIAQADAVTTRRKVERELEGTYVRLREVESRLPQAPPEPETALPDEPASENPAIASEPSSPSEPAPVGDDDPAPPETVAGDDLRPPAAG